MNYEEEGHEGSWILFRLEPGESAKYLTAVQRLSIAVGAAEGELANILLNK